MQHWGFLDRIKGEDGSHSRQGKGYSCFPLWDPADTGLFQGHPKQVIPPKTDPRKERPQEQDFEMIPCSKQPN